MLRDWSPRLRARVPGAATLPNPSKSIRSPAKLDLMTSAPYGLSERSSLPPAQESPVVSMPVIAISPVPTLRATVAAVLEMSAR
jgi:hypothetical protein